MVRNLISKLPYKVIISDNYSLFQNAILNANVKNKKVLILTDNNVKKLYGNKFIASFPKKIDNSIYLYSISSGEKFKNLDTCEKIYKFMLKNCFSRSDLIVAFGGGMVSDIAGFVAATFMRGIEYCIVPTTLLSMCDSSIGGKTAVNVNEIKNCVGAFKNPIFVYLNISLLLTLKSRDYINGISEIIKHALISDKEFFVYIEKYKEKILQRDLKTLKYVVFKSITIKSKFILKDPYDSDIRKILNFGHTFGHAIETNEHFRKNHGESVAIGMRIAMDMSSFTEIDRVLSLFNYFGLDTNYNAKNMKRMFSIIKNDKKAKNGKIAFVFLRKIGQAYIKEIKI